MEGKLFIGIADNDRFASVVVGDACGKIIATSVGGSVNYHFWGIEQARTNLRDLVARTVGWDRRRCLAGACFTYKADFAVSEWSMIDLVSGFLEPACVTVEDFATSSILGLDGSRDRLFLVGGHSGLAIFEDGTGNTLQIRQGALVWSPSLRLTAKLRNMGDLGHTQDVESLLRMTRQIRHGKCLAALTSILDESVDQGSALALEMAYDVAFDLVQMVMDMAVHFRNLDPVIGLYGQLLLGSQTIRERVRDLIAFLFPHSQVMDAPLAPAKGAYLSSVLTRRTGFEEEVITNLFASDTDLDTEGWLRYGSEVASNGKNHYRAL